MFFTFSSESTRKTIPKNRKNGIRHNHVALRSRTPIFRFLGVVLRVLSDENVKKIFRGFTNSRFYLSLQPMENVGLLYLKNGHSTYYSVYIELNEYIESGTVRCMLFM